MTELSLQQKLCFLLDRWHILFWFIDQLYNVLDYEKAQGVGKA